MALFCPLQNVTLLIVEEFALRTGVHIPWPQLERLADEIACSVEHKVRHTHQRFFAPRDSEDEEITDEEITDEEINRILDELAEEMSGDDRTEARRMRDQTVTRDECDDGEAVRSRELPRQAA